MSIPARSGGGATNACRRGRNAPRPKTRCAITLPTSPTARRTITTSFSRDGFFDSMLTDEGGRGSGCGAAGRLAREGGLVAGGGDDILIVSSSEKAVGRGGRAGFGGDDAGSVGMLPCDTGSR